MNGLEDFFCANGKLFFLKNGVVHGSTRLKVLLLDEKHWSILFIFDLDHGTRTASIAMFEGCDDMSVAGEFAYVVCVIRSRTHRAVGKDHDGELCVGIENGGVYLCGNLDTAY